VQAEELDEARKKSEAKWRLERKAEGVEE